MGYRALFLDIDDTLVTKGKQISPGNMAAVGRAQEAGIFVTVATGRGFLGAAPIWKQMRIKGPVIVYGGAMIMDTVTGKALYKAQIEPKLIREALALAREWNLHAQIYLDDTVIFAKENEFTKAYTSYMNLPYVVDPAFHEKDWLDIPKVLVYAQPGAEEKEMIVRFSKHFEGRLEVASSKAGYIEINRCGDHKGSAILRAAEFLGVTQPETVAVGDNTLDLQMIGMAGLGICVENGQQVVKDISDVIAPSCEQDGVAWVIDHIMLSEEGSRLYAKRNHHG